MIVDTQLVPCSLCGEPVCGAPVDAQSGIEASTGVANTAAAGAL